jgi:hypothetical protein
MATDEDSRSNEFLSDMRAPLSNCCKRAAPTPWQKNARPMKTVCDLAKNIADGPPDDSE